MLLGPYSLHFFLYLVTKQLGASWRTMLSAQNWLSCVLPPVVADRHRSRGHLAMGTCWSGNVTTYDLSSGKYLDSQIMLFEPLSLSAEDWAKGKSSASISYVFGSLVFKKERDSLEKWPRKSKCWGLIVRKPLKRFSLQHRIGGLWNTCLCPLTL